MMHGPLHVVRKVLDHEFLDGLDAFLERPPIVLKRRLPPSRVVSLKPKTHWLEHLLEDEFDDEPYW